MDLINTGSDPWILEYDACENVSREIMEHLNARNCEKTSSQAYDALSAKIRIKLKQFSTELAKLNTKLNLASVVSTLVYIDLPSKSPYAQCCFTADTELQPGPFLLTHRLLTANTQEERERRQRQVEGLQSKEVQLLDLFNRRKQDNSDNIFNKTRAELFEKKGKEQVFADMGTTSWGESRSNDDDFDKRTVEDMKSENERLLKEQNEGLESLLKIVTNQKQIATSINDEVEHHNEILVDIADGMERVDGRINHATDMVQLIGKKESIWGYWLIAFLLLIAILGVAFA